MVRKLTKWTIHPVPACTMPTIRKHDIYRKYLNENLRSVGIDGWWMDSTEPDHFHPIPEDFDTPTYLGSENSSFKKSIAFHR